MENGKWKIENEIIIDGVNVAGCCNNRCVGEDNGEKLYICDEYIDGSCEGHNCYYKQFQRLKQENEELKEINRIARATIDDGRAENKRFREENEKLKEEVLHQGDYIVQLSYDNEYLAEKENEATHHLKEASKYKQALEEIRECVTLDDVNCTISAETQNVCNDVLKVLKEVLNDK